MKRFSAKRERITLGEELIASLTRACDTTMPRRAYPRHGHRPVYWWSESIAILRASCLQARRRMQRARTTESREERRVALRAAKAALNKEIARRKRACFDSLCQSANTNPWGDAYKVVMAKTRGVTAPPERSPAVLAPIVGFLFPRRDVDSWPRIPGADQGEVSRVTNSELGGIARSLVVGKAPGPDGIPVVALRAAVAENPDMFRSVFQTCLDVGVFPDAWKRQKLVLLPKPGKPPGDPSAYRPICLLDTTGKLLERVILNRLSAYTEGVDGLSSSQYGFRKGRSTVDAIRDVIQTAEVVHRKRRGIRYCAVLTLDVKNAFNSACWGAIARSLHQLQIPGGLYKILESYFQNRVLTYDTEDGEKCVRVTAGVPQGSILGPVLWNVMYDGLLRIKFPVGVKIVGFADDVTLVVCGESLEEVELTAAHCVRLVEEWMRTRKLELAHHKTEVVVVNNRMSVQHATLTVGGSTIRSVRSLKLLGVMLDDKLSFGCHVEYACKRASMAVGALSRMMSNSSAVNASKRRLLAGVVVSILRYGGPAWAAVLDIDCHRQKLESTHRLMCLRVASAYRTISREAVCVIAGMMPISLIIKEDVACYDARTVRGVRNNARVVSTARWQLEWENSTKGRWTYRLIPSVSSWVNRRHGEVNFHLTQFLSGHGCFRSYLHRFGHASTPTCPTCAGVEETAEHVVFACPRFEPVSSAMLAICGADTSPDNIVHRMCGTTENWSAVVTAVTHIVSVLQRQWRAEQQLPTARPDR